jgi:hypothetical protein
MTSRDPEGLIVQLVEALREARPSVEYLGFPDTLAEIDAALEAARCAPVERPVS